MMPFANSLQMILAVAFGSLLGAMALFCAFMCAWENISEIEAMQWLLFRIGWLRAVLVLLCFIWVTDLGATKGGILSGNLRATYLTIMANGTLAGPTNVVASAAGAAAVQAVVNSATTFMTTASNALNWARVEIPDLEAAVTNTKVAWLTGDVPQNTSGGNLVARCDLLQAQQSTNGQINCFVRFNLTPATAPIVQFEAGSADGQWQTFASVSNSFPNLVPVYMPDGVSSCYVYTVQTPAPLTGMTLIPQQAMTFGGGSSNVPLGVLGSVMVNSKVGRTTSTVTNGSQRLVFAGGVLVGVL